MKWSTSLAGPDDVTSPSLAETSLLATAAGKAVFPVRARSEDADLPDAATAVRPRNAVDEKYYIKAPATTSAHDDGRSGVTREGSSGSLRCLFVTRCQGGGVRGYGND